MQHQADTILEVCRKVDETIKTDFGGGSPVPKTFLMSYLIQNQSLKSFVEIGVYRGKSLFSVAYSIYKNGGTSYGIDPYSAECAMEDDVTQDLKPHIDHFVETTDFGGIYNDVLRYREACSYGESIRLLRQPSEQAIQYFKRKQIKPDILHIDGNHDTKFVRKDFDLYYDIMENDSFIVFDDIDWDSVRVVYEQAKEKCYCIFESPYFGILMKANISVSSQIKAEKLRKKLEAVFCRIQEQPTEELPLITVGMLTYNHGKYIEQALRSVLNQHGNFRLHVIICDDNSTDDTQDGIADVLAEYPQNDRLTVDYYRNKPNLGVVANFEKLVMLIKDTNCDYFSFCEGDDYYLTSDRLEKHRLLCSKNPQLSFSYNDLMLYWQEEDRFEVYNSGVKADTLSTEDLAKNNFIGNLNATFIRGDILKSIDQSLFENTFCCDWMFHIYCSQFGDIGRIKTPYNVYRKHKEGMWAGSDSITNNIKLLQEIEGYDRYLNFTYTAEFEENRKTLTASIAYQGRKYPNDTSVMIIDDVFPHPLSGFRYQEFTSILENIPNSRVFATFQCIHVLGKETANELMISYKRQHPDIADRVVSYTPSVCIDGQVLYCTFIQSAHLILEKIAEVYKKPFVFTLYPGGGFSLGTKEGDAKLRAVFSSPWFYKVIVTQDITYRYLLDHGFCTEDQIEYIFGVVMPLDKLELQIANKKHYGLDKDTLDICFVAHKYTKHGEDKGYDIFIEAAKKLSTLHDNIHFHVVGPWDETVLSTKGIRHITFYGSHNQEWFDDFYADKDIILSPNVHGKIFKGSFDGFPTGCVTDAAIRDVAMFLTDPLSLNQGRFVDGKEIVIVRHDADDVVKRISYYLDKPEELRDLCMNGHKKVRELYSFDAQILPRIQLLSKAAEMEFTPKDIVDSTATTALSLIEESLPLWKKLYRKFVPRPIKRLWRIFKNIMKAAYRELVPNLFKRIWRRVKRFLRSCL